MEGVAAQMRAVHVCLYVVKPLKKKKNQFIRYCVKQAAFFLSAEGPTLLGSHECGVAFCSEHP